MFDFEVQAEAGNGEAGMEERGKEECIEMGWCLILEERVLWSGLAYLIGGPFQMVD